MIIIEMLIAICSSVDMNSSRMVCRKGHSEFWNRKIINSFYPDPENHYTTDTCWVVNDRNERTLIVEDCKDFSKRLK